MLKIGDIEIAHINDARILVDTGGPFGLVPPALFERYYEIDDQHRVPMDHHCLLVRNGNKVIVVDTGYGTRMPEKMVKVLGMTRPEGGLVAGLAKYGVQPEDVDLVINTHLHNDHCGGNTYLDEGGELCPTFPNATYVVQEREYQDAAAPNERTRGAYFVENYVPLAESGQMELQNGEVEVIPGMRIVSTPGHTPGHTCVVFEVGDEAAIFVADLASMYIHFVKTGWMTAYDVEPLITLETKRKWQRWALERNAFILMEHDPIIKIGRLVEEDGKLSMEHVLKTDS